MGVPTAWGLTSGPRLSADWHDSDQWHVSDLLGRATALAGGALSGLKQSIIQEYDFF